MNPSWCGSVNVIIRFLQCLIRGHDANLTCSILPILKFARYHSEYDIFDT